MPNHIGANMMFELSCYVLRHHTLFMLYWILGLYCVITHLPHTHISMNEMLGFFGVVLYIQAVGPGQSAFQCTV